MIVLIQILLTILKILLIILGILLILLFVLLFFPFFWKCHLIRREEEERAVFRLSLFFFILSFQADYGKEKREEPLQLELRFFGLPVLALFRKLKSFRNRLPSRKRRHYRKLQKEAMKEFQKEVRQEENEQPPSKDKRPIEEDRRTFEREKHERTEQGRSRKFFLKLQRGFGRASDWISYVRSASFAEAKKAALREISIMLRHLFPSSLKGRLLFGLGDPASTGKALGILSLFGPLWQKVEITPDFQEKRLESDLTLKGWFILGILLWHILVLLMHKDIRKLMARFR